MRRSAGHVRAAKRARVYPDGEGVPYYMLSELAVLHWQLHAAGSFVIQRGKIYPAREQLLPLRSLEARVILQGREGSDVGLKPQL